MSPRIDKGTITLEIREGEAKVSFGDRPCWFALPNLGISIEGYPENIERIANIFFRGDATPELVEALREISGLDSWFQKHLLERFERGSKMVAECTRRIREFEEAGYQYFPSERQLLVRGRPHEFWHPFPVVSFIDEKRASVVSINHEDVINGFMRWLSTGKANLTSNLTHPVRRKISPEQGELVAEAVSKLNLPYERVGRAIRLIGGYASAHKQEKLFEKLESTGFSDAELRAIEEKVKEREATRAREEKYKEAQFREFAWLEDTKELVLPSSSLVIDLSSDPPKAFVVRSSYEHEMGRYIVRRKWGKRASLKPADDFPLFQVDNVVASGRKALDRIPEPYRTRLGSFLVSLRLLHQA